MKGVADTPQAHGGTTHAPTEVVRLYVCPEDGCGNYYGSSSMGVLEGQENTDLRGEHVSWRSRCPSCGAERRLRHARLVPEDEEREAVARETARVKARAAS